MIKALHYLKVFEVLDEDQKEYGDEPRPNDKESQYTDSQIKHGNWEQFVLDTEGEQQSRRPGSGREVELKEIDPTKSAQKTAKERTDKSDFATFLSTYVIANKTEVKTLKKYLDAKV